MSRSITLWKRNTTVSSDEACTTITSYSLPKYIPGPYEHKQRTTEDAPLVFIPSLQSLCIRQLAAFPDQIHTLNDISLPYEPPASPGDYDILQELIPDYSYFSESQDNGAFLNYVDPRLWAVLVQVYTGLPDVFRSYTLPLSDIHLSLLQQIPSTPRFALVTTLDLHHCSQIDDDTIVELRDLHGLAALDVGATALGSWGVSKLSKTLRLTSDTEVDISRRLNGPWGLRTLCLRDCLNVNDDVCESLRRFPLLSVIGTRIHSIKLLICLQT